MKTIHGNSLLKNDLSLMRRIQNGQIPLPTENNTKGISIKAYPFFIFCPNMKPFLNKKLANACRIPHDAEHPQLLRA